MKKFKATAVGDIPKNRLVCLTRPSDGEANKIYIRLAMAEEVADFVSSDDITDGDEVQVTIKNEPIWAVEAAEDIVAGVSVVTDDEGKLKTKTEVSSPATMGYTLHSAKAGEVVKYNRIYKVVNFPGA